MPVIFAAASLGIPIICHESDFTPGLANKLTIPFTKKICCNFPETVSLLPKGKAVCTGAPIREELLQGSREEGLKLCGFSGEKPVLMVKTVKVKLVLPMKQLILTVPKTQNKLQPLMMV